MHVIHEVCTVLVVLCLALTGGLQQREPQVHHNSSPSRRHRRTVDLVNAFQGEGLTGNTEQYMHYTPTTPAPDDIDCVVVVPTTIRKGGRCVRLGGPAGRRGTRGLWGCQAGLYLAFSSDCPSSRGRGGRGGRGGTGVGGRRR